MSGISLKSVIFGFIAGALATVTVHELIGYGLLHGGVFKSTPWDMNPVPPWGIPHISSDALWGGLWGVIFAMILGNIPKGSMTLRGALLGILGPGLLSGLVLMPMLRNEAFFYGGDLGAVGAVLLIAAGFGAATAWLYGFMASGFRLP